MATLFIYMLKSAACLAVLFMFYRLLLSRETFHRFNRMALLSLLVISSLVPFVELPAHEMAGMGISLPAEEGMMPALDAASEPVEEAAVFTWREGLLLTYLAGMAFFLLRLVWAHLRLWHLIRRCTPYRKEADGTRILTHTDRRLAPFSWQRFIILSEADMAENGRAILMHERAHIRAHHSLDLMVADLCLVLQWFNPTAWLLVRELRHIHEYEADQGVLCGGVDLKTYQMLLIKKAAGTRLYSMANSLNQSSLNKRIIMMMKRKSNPWARAKYLYVLPLAAVSVTALARTEVSNLESELVNCEVSQLFAFMHTEEGKSVESLPIEPEKAPAPLPQSEENDSIYNRPEVKAQFPGGEVASFKFIADHIKYPEEAQKKGQEGRVYLTLVVNKDGSVTDPKVARTCGVPELDNEAIRVARQMPNWTPARHKGEIVRSRHLFPIYFRLNSGKATATTSTSQPRPKSFKDTLRVGGTVSVAGPTLKPIEGKVLYVEEAADVREVNVSVAESSAESGKEEADTVSVSSTQSVKGNVLYLEKTKVVKDGNGNSKTVSTPKLAKQLKNTLILIDGKEADDTEVQVLDPEQIEDITVLKDPTKNAGLVDKYGDKIKNGVMLVTTKSAKLLKNPLVLIDGKEASQEAYETLAPDQIEDITILKEGSEGLAPYGEKGKNGVMLITTKKSN